jgi:GTPase SAR1 family protein
MKLSNKIFITGATGTGKTTLAKKLKTEQFPYYDFDLHWDYNEIAENQDDIFLKELPGNFVIDGIPLSKTYETFIKYYNKNKSTVICTFKSDLNKWVKNILLKSFYTIDNPIYNMDFYNYLIKFYDGIIDLIENSSVKIQFFDTIEQKEYTFNEFENWFELTKHKINQLESRNLFRNCLDAQIYDKYYGDIEFINFEGYSHSWKTWENIKNLIKWKDKIVIDCGCFHGYFCIKVKDSGAKQVIGLDIYDEVLETTKLIAKINKKNIEFLKWEGGEPTPKCDIALILNMLHHCKNQEKTLQNINCQYGIFEIEKSQKELVEKYFKTIKKVVSHRVDVSQDRIILLGLKRS